MAGHGLQKLTCSFGGHGPEAAGEMFEQIGFKPGRQFAVVTGAAETAGGVMMVAGLGTPLACSMISGVMAAAIAKVHYKNGFWASDRGYELNLHILAATFAVAGAGGGALALDGLRGRKHKGFGWALAQLVLGATAAAGAIAVAERLPGGRLEQEAAGPDSRAPGNEETNGSMVDLSREGVAGDQTDATA
jgi:putative oxidoreductase